MHYKGQFQVFMVRNTWFMDLRYFPSKQSILREGSKNRSKLFKNIVTILWLTIIGLETGLLFNEYDKVCNKIEGFLRSIWKHECSLLSCLFGTLEQELGTTYKYKPHLQYEK